MTIDSLPSDRKLSREQAAQLEMSRTVVRPRTAWALIAIFLSLVSAPTIVDWIAAERTDGGVPRPWSQFATLPRRAAARFFNADVQAGGGFIARIVAANRVVLAGLHEFEDAVNDESAVAGALRPAAQTLLSERLGVGNERVYEGHDGWLFYRPDVDYVIGAGFLDPHEMRRRRETTGEWIDQPQPDPRAAIVDFKRQLDARGIALVVVPTPVKPAMHPEKLADSRRLTVPVQNASYRSFIDDLRRQNVIVFDAAEQLANDASSSAAYLATDTHWRPEAMERTADLLGQFIQTAVGLAATAPPTYGIESRDVSNVGDTAAMLDLPPDHQLNRPESVTIHRVVDADGTPWRPSRDADVLVLGDSFTNIYSLASMGWGDAAGFAEHLGRALNRPIDRIVQNDNGAYATRERLRQEIASGSDRLRGKRVVVLQFASRELSAGNWKLIALPPIAPP
jgi:alginate O-acetyltransferase complex protein AlgJ